MHLERNIVFWLAALVVFIALLWLLSPILLPFVLGMAIAYAGGAARRCRRAHPLCGAALYDVAALYRRGADPDRISDRTFGTAFGLNETLIEFDQVRAKSRFIVRA